MSKANGLLNKDECRRRYEAGLAEFAQEGRRDYMVTRGGFVNWGKAAGLSAEDIIADAHAAGVKNRDGSIRTAWQSSTMRVDDGTAATISHQTRAQVHAPPPPKAKERFAVRTLVGDEAEASKGCADWVRDLSPFDVRHMTPAGQTAAFVRALLPPDAYVYMFANLKTADGVEYATRGKIGASVRRCADWVAAFENGTAAGFDHVVPNPMTGRWGHNKSGEASCISADCLAAFPFLIVEFDDMPLPKQCAFWRAFISTPHPLASALVAIVYSGGKSLHGLLCVGCQTRPQWDAVRNRIAALFDADENRYTHEEAYTAYCADGQAMRPRQGVRLAGVRRCDEHGEHTGAMQELLYLNPTANKSIAITAPCYIRDGELQTGYCGVCEHFNTCAHRNPLAVCGTTALRKG